MYIHLTTFYSRVSRVTFHWFRLYLTWLFIEFTHQNFVITLAGFSFIVGNGYATLWSLKGVLALEVFDPIDDYNRNFLCYRCLE